MVPIRYWINVVNYGQLAFVILTEGGIFGEMHFLHFEDSSSRQDESRTR